MKFRQNILNGGEIASVVKRPGFSNVFKGTALFVVYDDSLFLTFEDLVVLFELLIALE